MLKTVCFTDNDLGKFFIFRIVKFSLQELRSASNPSERILNFMGEISQQAPSIFGKMGFLKERKATSYPSKEAELFGAEVVKDSVVVSDFIITSRGLGTAIDFSLALIGLLLNKEKAEEIKDSVIYQCK